MTSEMSMWTRTAWGRSPTPSEQEKWRTHLWLAVRAHRRELEAEDAERRRLRELPGKQAAQIAKYAAMQRDPFAQRIAAAARRLEARRQADLDREVARIRAEKAAEERARATLWTEFGREPGRSTRGMPEAERRALEILRAEFGWK